jgi:hypothetical protein
MGPKENLFVTKRNGRGKESLNIDKIHSMVVYQLKIYNKY